MAMEMYLGRQMKQDGHGNVFRKGNETRWPRKCIQVER